MFYDLNNKATINVTKIREVRTLSDNSMRIIFNNGDSVDYNTFGDANIKLRYMTEDMIVQVIPCHAAIYNVFSDTDDEGNETYYKERVHFFALCNDGFIKSLSLADGYFDFAKEADNFKGFYGDDMPEEYKDKAK
jgi:hypothetical protein